MDFIDIGPECFADAEATVISYKGENYYKACGEFVADIPEGGQSFCVKRVGHPGKTHEAFHGNLREEGLDELRLQWGELASADQLHLLPKEALIASIKDLSGELLIRTGGPFHRACGPTDDVAECACRCSGYDDRCALYLEHYNNGTQVPESHTCCKIPGRTNEPIQKET